MINSKTLTKPLMISLSLGLTLLMLIFTHLPGGRGIETAYLDFLYTMKEPRLAEDVIVVAIDEASFAELNQQWPWPRSLHGNLIDELFKQGAKAVAFDVIFAEPSTSVEDVLLARAIKRWPAIVMAVDISVQEQTHFIQEIVVRPTGKLQLKNDQQGFINIPLDVDGIVRHSNNTKGDMYSLSLGAVKKSGLCCEAKIESISYQLNYLGPPGSIPSVSYYQALDADKYLNKGVFVNKIVFVGLQLNTSVDPTKATPDRFSVPYTRWGYGHMSGVEIHASSAQNMIDNSSIIDLSGGGYDLAVAILSLFFAVFFIFIVPSLGLGLIGIISLVLLVSSVSLFMTQHTYLPVLSGLIPLFSAYMTSPILRYLNSVRERRFIQTAFSSYLSPSIVKQLIKHPETLQPGGKKVEVSVLFLDIAGFTSLSEQYEPEVMVGIMNNILSSITNIVIRHEGSIDKFIGDAVMAVWGAPIEVHDHACKACRAALEIQSMLDILSKEEKKASGADISARIGINSGEVIAGNIGGSQRFDYTVQGNVVNVASRLEGINKYYSTRIMLGENTQQMLSANFTIRLIDKVRLKGKKQAISIYQLAEDTSANAEQCREYFDVGYQAYLSRQWVVAIEAFNQALIYDEKDGPSLEYLRRCKEYHQQPPGPAWSGIYDYKVK